MKVKRGRGCPIDITKDEEDELNGAERDTRAAIR